MDDPGQNVVIVGGGVIGAMCAWYLSRAGMSVTVVDRGRFGAACSHGNCGYVSPSHVLPLPQPGAIKKTLAAMLKRNSPFAIKPRFSSSFLSWFWKFSRQCNRESMMASAVGRNAILQSSKKLYQELVSQEGIECEWQEVGLLFVYDNEREFNEFRIVNDLLRENFGVGATPYEEKQLVELEPALKPGIAAGGWHYEGDCHMRPDLLMSSLRARMESEGVTFLENVAVESFVQENRVARAIKFGNEELAAETFIVATGAMTPFLNKHLGCKIPIEPGKGYSLTMPKPKRMPKLPLIFEDSHVAITPMKSKYRIGSTMEFVGYDTSINPKRLSLLQAAASKYLHDPVSSPIEEEWYGWRPMTWDGKPVIDRSPAMKNTWIAAGHNMLGISMATGTGRLVKELVLGEQPHLDVSHFALSRLR